LYEECTRGFGKGLATATAEGDPEIFAWEKAVGFTKHLVNLLGLHGIVTLVSIV
jgi:hypothetical protein